jgi:hypothetical protein
MMKGMKRHVVVGITALFLVHAVFSSLTLAQSVVPFMTLADGTKVGMTQAQFEALVKQPGIAYSPAGPMPQVAATQMAIPVPAELGAQVAGGGFIVGEPAAIAAGMNAVGITNAATAASLAGGTAAAGSIGAGAAAAGAAAAAGVGTGTIAIGAGVLAVGIGAAAAGGGGGGGGSSSTTTTTHHTTTSHH